MRGKNLAAGLILLLLTFGIVGCNQKKVTNLNPDTVKNAIKQAGYDNVGVDVDKDKGVVTLSGKVPSEQDKERVGQIAQGIAGTLVVANQVSIEPPGMESQAKAIEGNVDDSIDKQFKALLIANHWDKEHISYKTKNGVLTLKGKVPSHQQRTNIEKVAATVPNVTQVVNELQVSGRHAAPQS